jgi:hypothetical protein
MIKPNRIYEKGATVHGLPVPAALGAMSCILLFLGLTFGLKIDLVVALAAVFPFAVMAGFLSSSKNYQSFVTNLLIHPYYIYNEPEKIKRW